MAAAAAGAGAPPEELRIEALPPPGERFRLGERLGAGVYGEVFEATDAEQGGRRVAVKVVTLTLNVAADVREECAVLRRLCAHPNLPDLHGAFLRRGADRREPDQLWFALELCEGGPVTDLVTSLYRQGRRLSEEHIAYVLKETAKALWHLHENHVIHRDVRGSNILLTKDGEVKLVDFGFARELASTMGRSGTSLGSPCWMAPEVVAARDADGYDNRADVWALGIVAIELADGKPPFHDMHPTRALFQIARNPPPTLSRPASWTQVFNDFIEECLTKNPEYRPYMVEILEHPFLTEMQQKDYTLQQELRVLCATAAKETDGGAARRRVPEVAVRGHLLQASHTAPPERLRVEDLSALEPLEDDALLEEVLERFRRGEPYTFAGDVLVALGPVARDDNFPLRLHAKYRFKSRSDNAPHAFAVADRALQDALHHEEPQHVVLAGEACAGKSAQLRRLLAHFVFLGKSAHNVGERVERCLAALTAFGNAATPLHGDSTRHLLRLQLAFTRSGRLSGAVFHVALLEKWRVHCADSGQANFHVLYYLVDALEEDGKMRKFGLEPGRNYSYLRRGGRRGGSGGDGEGGDAGGGEGGPRCASRARNAAIFRRLEGDLREALGLEAAALEALWAALAAVLLLGELRFEADADDGDVAALSSPEAAHAVARLLAVDERRLCWALLNYCAVESGRTAVRRRHTVAQAGAARHALAATLYARLVDWLVNVANWRLSFTRAVYGDPHVVNLIDMFGFECQRVNGLEQLFVNTLNEQMQYYYNQRVFAWELREHSEEGLPAPPLRFADNKATLDALLARPKGLLHLLDDPSLRDPAQLLGALRRADHGPHVRVPPPAAVQGGALEFSVAHFTGTVTYRADGLHEKNRDFLPPDLVEVLRQSAEPVVQQLFSARLTTEGNLVMADETPAGVTPVASGGGGGGGDGIARRRRWGAAAAADKERRSGGYNTASRGRFSQSRGLRTASAVFRAASLEALRALAGGGLHAVRCLRASLAAAPRAAQPELLRQQLRALAVPDTARARRDGFPGRVPFAEFIRRYKFLAFDFDENVEETPDNCRLLLVRLKMEGWRMGCSKVFLTYYNEEYLARLYETHVTKVVRVQTMLRAFLAKRLVQKKARELLAAKQNKTKSNAKDNNKEKKEVRIKEEDGKDFMESPENRLREESAAIIIQKQYRGYRVRKQAGPTLHKSVSYPLNEETLDFIRSYCHRWRAKTLFQVLMLYRAARRQDFVYFCQQVHLYNQQAAGAARGSEALVPAHAVSPTVRARTWLCRPRLAVRKLPFRLCDVAFVDTTPFCQRGFDKSALNDESDGLDDESWDAPLTQGNFDDFPWPAPHRVRVRDQEAQTGAAGGEAAGEGASLARDSRLNTLKRSPFRRDARSLDETTAPLARHGPDASAVAVPTRARAPTAPERTAASSKEVSDSPGTRKQPAPPLPLRSAAGGAGPVTAVGVQRRAKPDHIAELQLLGRRPGPAGGGGGEDNDEEEDPPFNFKGMLRKTNCNRDSFKSQNKNGKTNHRDAMVQDANGVLNRDDSQYEENTYAGPDVSKLPSILVSKYDAVPSYTKASPSEIVQKENDDHWMSDEKLFDMNVESSHGESSNSLSNDSKVGDSTHDNGEENAICEEEYLKTSNHQENVLKETNWVQDVNSNVFENDFGADGDVTELVPGITIQGNQVADL